MLKQELFSIFEQTQTSNTIQQIAQKMQLKPREFAATVAFCGIHMTLYPLWIYLCEQIGVCIPLSLIDTDPQTIGESASPWKFIVFSCSSNQAIIHLQTQGLTSKPELFHQMMKHSFRQLISSLEENGRFIAYAEALPILSDIGCSTDHNVPIGLPQIQFAQLEEHYALWRQWGEQLQQYFKELLFKQSAINNSPEDFIALYREMAAVLWQELLQKGIIESAPIPTGWFNQLKGFRREMFHGTALLLGDHEEFWHKHERWV